MIVFRGLILTMMKAMNITPDPSGLKTHKDFIEMSVDELIKELELYAVNSAHELFHRIYP